MAEIKLFNTTSVALVDDEMLETLLAERWCLSNNGYAVRGKKTEGHYYKVHMHRVIANTPAGLECDHINRNKLDNRRCNLRNVTKSVNRLNAKVQRNNKSGVNGVSWDKKMSKWVAKKSGQYLGAFVTIEEAISVRLTKN